MVSAEAPDATDRIPGELLIYAPVPLHLRDGIFLLEGQACNGLARWADNFERLRVMMPLDPSPPPPDWVPLSHIGPRLDTIDLVPLPTAYRPDRFLAELPLVRRRIRALIAHADYLSFAIGGLFGDWGAVSCFEARRMGRPYAVWTDRVESEVVRRTAARHGAWKTRLRAQIEHRPMAWLEHAAIRGAELGLFHGRETFDAYKPYCRHPELVHDIHISKSDHIPPETLAAKVATAATGPLRVCYVGRAEEMKGPLDWVETLARVAAAGIDFQATWLGDGSQRAAMQERVAALGLEDRIGLPGFTTNRAALLSALRETHLFLFCHKTPESPRCLIEALISGSPIVGYDGAFARDLVSIHQGGIFTPLNDPAALAEAVIGLGRDRTRLADLIERAARDGAPFDDVSVFRHRSELIRAYLRPRRNPDPTPMIAAPHGI